MGRATLVLGLAVLALVGFAVAGCGGGGSKQSAGTTRGVGFSTVEAITEPTTTAAAPTTRAATTTSSPGGIASARNCRELAELGKKFQAAFTGAGNSQDLKQQVRLLKEFADRTPSDIRADFQALAAYLTKIADAVGNLKPGATPDAQTLAKLQKIATEVDQKKLTAASTHIAAWVQGNCKR